MAEPKVTREEWEAAFKLLDPEITEEEIEKLWRELKRRYAAKDGKSSETAKR